MEQRNLTLAHWAYKEAVEELAILTQVEAALVSADSSLAQVDTWQGAHFRKQLAQTKAKRAKEDYQAALRQAGGTAI